MKKVMFGLAAAAAIAAFGEGLESANTVGYNTKAVQAGKFAIFGPQFEATDGTTDINKIISGVTGVSQEALGDDFVLTAPHIQIPNAKGTYDLYYYLTDGYYDTGTVDGDGDPIYGQKAGWCDQGGIIAGEEIADVTGIVPVGAGFWTKGVGSTFSITFKK